MENAAQENEKTLRKAGCASMPPLFMFPLQLFSAGHPCRGKKIKLLIL